MNEGVSKSSHEIRDEFLKLQNRDDVAQLLGVTTKQLNFHLYVLPPKKNTRLSLFQKNLGELAKYLHLPLLLK